MKRSNWKIGALSVGIGLAASLLSGQRAPSAAYDCNRKVKFSGPITKIDWTNPSAFLLVNVRDSNSAVTSWEVDVGNPLELEKSGWKRDSVHIGDIVNIEGTPARGPEFQAKATSVVMARTGAKLFAIAAKPAVTTVGQPAPRWPGGHARLGPAPGKKGYWGPPSSTVLMESGVNVPMNKDGLLVNISDAGRVAPFQPWAKAVYESRQLTLLKDDPYNKCIPPGGVRHFQNPYGFQFYEQPEIGRILLFLGGGDRNWRIIYTDGRAMGQKEDLVLTYYGTSAGRWEGDTLTVDTVGFNEKFCSRTGDFPIRKRCI